MHNYSKICKRLLPISILSPLQVASLVICLKIPNATIIPTVAGDIQPFLTSHIWITCRQTSDNNLSVTMHIVTKDFKLHSFALEPFPLHDLPHNREFISEMWVRVCANAHSINNNHMPPDITTNGAFNMVTAGD